ncbi:MAG: HTTM domain-containing protein [Sandaracinaceae bacterium]
MPRAIAAIRRRLEEPWDVAGLVAFRVIFGLLLLAAVARTVLSGWVETFYLEPTFAFHYPGFDWVATPPGPVLYALFAVLAVSALAIAVGALYRVATVVFLAVFAYVELLDVTFYLNHYVLVSLLAALLAVLPLHRAGSVDAWLRPSIRVRTLPAWMTWALRFQVGVVYVFAALAKLQPDWLLHGQPLGIWLASRSDLAVVGPWMDDAWLALTMSWAGFLYDLTIPLWLLWRRSRPFALAVVLAFHAATGVLFNIGMFPWLMSGFALVFFDPSWPRSLARRFGWRQARDKSLGAPAEAVRLRRPAVLALALWAGLQVAIPLRAHAYGGDVLWHEQGMRFSWRVMVRQKSGSVVYRVRTADHPAERYLRPDQYLTLHQEREMSGQPDLIVQLAHRIAGDLEARGERGVEVRVDAWASLNGRPRARLIDPDVDLTEVHPSVLPATWIAAAPEGPPLPAGGRPAYARTGRR